ncbi:hypothetical protein [Paracoccus sp. FO-3]|uniref:hypothetical protein n=1 Tax=Paracoccus sp. FO-3 TaxID=1335059 RepID=UPI0015E30808|nr:hypothetical protein [Paracoccus sp. FO-3]
MAMTSVRFREILLQTKQLIVVRSEAQGRTWFTLETLVDGRTCCFLSLSRTSAPKRFRSPDKVTRLVSGWGMPAVTMPLQPGRSVNQLSAATCRAIEAGLTSGRRAKEQGDDLDFPTEWGPIGELLAAGRPPEEIAASSGLPLSTVNFLVTRIRDGRGSMFDDA